MAGEIEIYKNHDHFNGLNEMRKSGDLCDVVFHVGGERFSAHRNVLIGCSMFFRSLLSNDMKESNQSEITFQKDDLDPRIFEKILDYIYTGQVVINKENALLLLCAFQYFQFPDAATACAKFLIKFIKNQSKDVQNDELLKEVVDMRCWVSSTSCKGLLATIDKFLGCNLERLMTLKNFSELSSNHLISLIESDYLYVTEKSIFDACIKWVQHQREERVKYLPKILEKIRLSTEFLKERLNAEQLISEDDKELQSYWNEREEIEANKGPFEESRKPNDNPSGKIYVVGGMVSENMMEIFNPAEKMWSDHEKINSTIVNMGSAVVNRGFYILGGSESGDSESGGSESGGNKNCLSTVKVYNTETHEWLGKKNMTVARRFLAVTAIGNLIYVCGGQNDLNSYLNHVEFYDSTTDSWTDLPPMLRSRMAASAVALNGFIYVLGGYVENENATDSVERYNPNTSEWENIESMIQKRAHHAAAVLDGKIYVCGGENEAGELASVEFYDPKKKKWNLVAQMNSERTMFALVSNLGKLWAFGGTLKRSSGSLESFDPDTEEWTMEISMIHEREGHVAGVIP